MDLTSLLADVVVVVVVGLDDELSRRSRSGRLSVKSKKLFSVVEADVVSALLVGKLTSSSVTTRSIDAEELFLLSTVVVVAAGTLVDG